MDALPPIGREEVTFKLTRKVLLALYDLLDLPTIILQFRNPLSSLRIWVLRSSIAGGMCGTCCIFWHVRCHCSSAISPAISQGGLSVPLTVPYRCVRPLLTSHLGKCPEALELDPFHPWAALASNFRMCSRSLILYRPVPPNELKARCYYIVILLTADEPSTFSL